MLKSTFKGNENPGPRLRRSKHKRELKEIDNHRAVREKGKDEQPFYSTTVCVQCARRIRLRCTEGYRMTEMTQMTRN